MGRISHIRLDADFLADGLDDAPPLENQAQPPLEDVAISERWRVRHALRRAPGVPEPVPRDAEPELPRVPGSYRLRSKKFRCVVLIGEVETQGFWICVYMC